MSPLSSSPRDLLSSSPQGGKTLTKEQYRSLLSSTERKILGLSFTDEHPERVTLGLSAGEALTETLIQSTLTPHFWQSIGITTPPAIASIALLPGGEAHVSLGNGKTMIIEGTTAPLGAILMQLQSMKTLETLQTLFRETGLTVFTPAGKPPVLLLPEAGVDLSSFITSCNAALRGSGFSLELSTTKDALLLIQKKDTDPASTEVGRMRVITPEWAKQASEEERWEIMSVAMPHFKCFEADHGVYFGTKENATNLMTFFNVRSSPKDGIVSFKINSEEIKIYTTGIMEDRLTREQIPLREVVDFLTPKKDTVQEKEEKQKRIITAFRAFGPTSEEFCKMSQLSDGTDPRAYDGAAEQLKFRLLGKKLWEIAAVFGFFPAEGKEGVLSPATLFLLAEQIYAKDDPGVQKWVSSLLNTRLSERISVPQFEDVCKIPLGIILEDDLKTLNAISRIWINKPFRENAPEPRHYGRDPKVGDFVKTRKNPDGSMSWWIDLSELVGMSEVGEKSLSRMRLLIWAAMTKHLHQSGKHSTLVYDPFMEYAHGEITESTDLVTFARKITFKTLIGTRPDLKGTVNILTKRGITVEDFIRLNPDQKSWNIVWPKQLKMVMRDDHIAFILGRVKNLMERFMFVRNYQRYTYNPSVGLTQEEKLRQVDIDACRDWDSVRKYSLEELEVDPAIVGAMRDVLDGKNPTIGHCLCALGRGADKVTVWWVNAERFHTLTDAQRKVLREKVSAFVRGWLRVHEGALGGTEYAPDPGEPLPHSPQVIEAMKKKILDEGTRLASAIRQSTTIESQSKAHKDMAEFFKEPYVANFFMKMDPYGEERATLFALAVASAVDTEVTKALLEAHNLPGDVGEVYRSVEGQAKLRAKRKRLEAAGFTQPWVDVAIYGGFVGHSANLRQLREFAVLAKAVEQAQPGSDEDLLIEDRCMLLSRQYYGVRPETIRTLLTHPLFVRGVREAQQKGARRFLVTVAAMMEYLYHVQKGKLIFSYLGSDEILSESQIMDVFLAGGIVVPPGWVERALFGEPRTYSQLLGYMTQPMFDYYAGGDLNRVRKGIVETPRERRRRRDREAR